MNKINMLFILAINHYTGVTTWAYELIKGINQFDVDVVFISDNPYLISEKEYVKDVSQYANVISSVDFSKKYDVVLLHNTDHEDIAKKVGENTIFVSHSSMVDNANPKLKHSKHVTVSGRSKYVLDADMFILNGIDLDKFKSNRNVNEIPKICLYHNRTSPQDFVFEACGELNIELIFWNTIESDVREKIDKSDFVMGYGRSVYEAMSMSKPVLVFGHNSPINKNRLNENGISSNIQGGFSDGWVDESNFKEMLHRNCCGWDKKIYIDNKKDMINMIKGYDYKMGEANRTLAEKHMSSTLMVNSFKEVVHELV
jgi:hypothetical protein